MVWKKIRYTKEDRQFVEANLMKDCRFLVDENLGIAVAEVLRDLGWKASHTSEKGLTGWSDERIYQYARKHDLVLLTHDLDFLNNRRYPLQTCPGVVVIPDDGKDSTIESALTLLILLFAPHREICRGSKIYINGDRTGQIYGLSFDGRRFASKFRYLRGKPPEYFDE